MGQSFHLQCNIYFSDKPSVGDEFTDDELDENRAYMFFQEKRAQGYSPREIMVDALNALADGDVRYRRRDIPIAESVISDMMRQAMDVIADQMDTIGNAHMEAVTSALSGASFVSSTVEHDAPAQVDDMSSTVMSNILNSLSSRKIGG